MLKKSLEAPKDIYGYLSQARRGAKGRRKQVRLEVEENGEVQVYSPGGVKEEKPVVSKPPRKLSPFTQRKPLPTLRD